MRLVLPVLVLVAVPLAASCNGPLPIPAGCSPLLYDHDCALPFPSDFFLVDDATLPTGKRIQFADKAKLLTEHGASADPNDVWPADGFSRVTPIVFTFGVRTDQASVPRLFDDASITAKKGFKTALFDATTGERVAHFIDVDPLADVDAREGLIMHPLVRLKEKTRYIVAISGVNKKAGGLVDAPEAFRRLRDKAADGDPVLAPLLARYEKEIFPVIAKDGLAREELQLAWDFTTGSDEHVMDDMLTARTLALAAMATTPPVVEITGEFEGAQAAQILGDDATETWRLIRGNITGPRVDETDEPGSLLHRGADGKVALNGTHTFSFTAIIPASVRDSGVAAQPMAYGHGFFGDSSELQDLSARTIADHSGVVMIGIDWEGMSSNDVGEVVGAVGGEVSKTVLLAERVMQSMVNWMAVTNAMKSGAFNQLPAFQRPVRDGSVPLIDVSKPVAFTGISLGHVLGGTMVALNPEIERAVLMVGGEAFTTMFFRARPFNRFLAIMKLTLPDALDRQKVSAFMQPQFDRFDPATFAPYVIGEDLPSGPSNHSGRRHVLQMMGIGDSQVPNVASELHARTMGVPLMTPAPGRTVFDLEQKTYPRDGSGLVIYDLGVDDSFYSNAEPLADGNIVHEGVRRVPQALDQMKQFFADGTITDVCAGACVIDPSGLNIPTG